jgi:hypothetical protein
MITRSIGYPYEQPFSKISRMKNNKNFGIYSGNNSGYHRFYLFQNSGQSLPIFSIPSNIGQF